MGFNKSAAEPEPALVQWFKEKLNILPGFKQAMWADSEHMEPLTLFSCKFTAQIMHGYLESSKDSTNLAFRLAFNPHQIKSPVGDVIYFVREPGQLTPDTASAMVKVGRSKPQALLGMSDLNMLVKRRQASARNPPNSSTTSVQQQGTGGLRLASTAPCHASLAKAANTNTSARLSEQGRLRPLSGTEMHPSVLQARPYSARSRINSGRPLYH
mmetsp:Transcript_20956/g.35132  ORF Transcript_20956/g.35132 Transcript_20956/m.35132 type:complete len:213 (-) Transcript_20956:250-888(-)|eukprot:CAMPEP_0198216248 /NCGR_PEP_ID=MMETSP1445-20131203/56144_1 /TAXON_ID=36898 /ORGANISM="Pyramimonas sp., Strain CCMP2087" /LENGTH=212 /DNA_ID=CAMNT_0043892393 /DNA_START=461 /DNA_END=1099 /DNA_ORIENTATION=+